MEKWVIGWDKHLIMYLCYNNRTFCHYSTYVCPSPSSYCNRHASAAPTQMALPKVISFSWHITLCKGVYLGTRVFHLTANICALVASQEQAKYGFCHLTSALGDLA